MDNNPVDTERLRVGREASYGTLARTVEQEGRLFIISGTEF